MWTAPQQLEGEHVVLRPLTLEDAERLVGVVEPTFFRYFVGPVCKGTSPQEVREFVEALLAAPNSMAFVVIHRETGAIIGSSSFLDIREGQRGIEIGRTWIVPAHRGTAVNPEMKLLMLRHAFEEFKCVRVQLKCDALNKVSAAAIQKLGAEPEGILQHHRIRLDGTIGDTSMFGITVLQWRDVKRGLERRLRQLRDHRQSVDELRSKLMAALSAALAALPEETPVLNDQGGTDAVFGASITAQSLIEEKPQPFWSYHEAIGSNGPEVGWIITLARCIDDCDEYLTSCEVFDEALNAVSLFMGETYDKSPSQVRLMMEFTSAALNLRDENGAFLVKEFSKYV